MKRILICLLFFSSLTLHAQNKGLYIDIGSGWFIDPSGGGALAPLTITSSYFIRCGFGASIAYGYYIFGDKNKPNHSHSLFVGLDYSIPAKIEFQGFPVNHSFSGGLYTHFGKEKVSAPSFEWEAYIYGNGEIFSHFYIVNRFSFYIFFGKT